MEMVVGASEATMKSLLSKLGGLLAHEYALIRGVRGDIQYINDEMASMQAFLGDLSSAAAAPQGHDRRIRDWMKQIRDVTYDIEDCVDDFAHRLSHDPAAGRDVWCVFLSSTAYEIWTWRPRRKIASSIAELRLRAQQIGERRTRYGVRNPKSVKGGPPAGFQAADYQHTTLALIGTKEPVGVDDEMEELGKYLQRASSDQGVLSIVGFGGVGKTTIATKLYQKYGDQFDRRATVTVSQSSDIDAILQTILSQVKPQSKDDSEQQGSSGGGPSMKKCIMADIGTLWGAFVPKGRKNDESRGGSTSQTTKDQLKQHLEGYSYLLLVDDVWSATMWETIKKSLPKNTKGSRVIVTTRFQAVASACKKDKGDHIHKVVVLNGHKSEELFRTESGISKDKLKELFRTKSGISKDKPKELSMTESGIGEDKPKELSMTEFRSGKDKPKELSRTKSGISKDKPKELSMTESGIGEDKPRELSMTEFRSGKDKPKELSRTESGKQNQEKIPPRLWQMCGGLPLAIVTMAGHAACNTEKPIEEWTKLCNALVPDSTKALGQDGVTRILSHCYNDMPGEIKTCSLYLCIFPKGRRVSRKRLTRRWVAEGFVSEKDGLSAEDVAEAYFNYLVRRKIIRAVEHSSNGKVKSYQVHDMVLEYIISKASEENFVTVVGGHWLMAPPSNKVRRLSLQDGDSKHKKTIESMNLSHVRSLTVFRSLTQLPSNSLKFGIVQVLDLEGCNDFRQHHAKEICKMLLLKYLSLRRTDINNIPKKIGKLQYLETLDIRETNVTELPNAVCQLERVVNILGGNKRTRKALKLPEDLKKKTMKSLRILSGIEIVEGSAAVADFHHLTDLRKLTIYKLNIKTGGKLFQDLSSSIEYLGGYSLHTLVIDDESSEFLKSLAALSSPPKFLNALELSGKLVELPGWITELEALTKLTLSVTALTADALRRLSKLRTLFSLTFSLTAAKPGPETTAIMEENKENSDGEIIVPAGGFENLNLLRFSAPCAPLLSFPKNALPKLERLELRFSMFEGLYGLENLAELKEVHLRVHDEAGEFTQSLVQEMASAAREDGRCARIIVDQYHV